MKPRALCQGIALPSLMVLLSLASLATLLAMRNLWLNEQLLNAEADQLRTQHKAQAVLAIALADLLGTNVGVSGAAASSLRHTAGLATQNHAFFPTSLVDYGVLRQRLAANTCSAGICAPNTLEISANTASGWKTRIDVAMPVSAADTPLGDASAWYWVDVFVQTNQTNFVYRITVLANGIMPSSSTVLQAIWSRDSLTASTGQWRSWHVLRE